MAHLPACTIASNNYLALAKVLADSYRDHHPGTAVYCAIVDEPDNRIDYDALPFTCIFARDLPIPSFRSFAFRYDILELNTAIKPFFLSHLRDKFQQDRVLYFDPDILVMDTVTGIEAAVASHQAVLTPHITAPLDNDYDPAERKIRMVGVYNLGFLGLRLDASTSSFLDWWQARLTLYCQNDPWHGVFVDQAWMDFAPAFLERVAILRDPAYNVAYWNLAHRRINRQHGRWTVGDRPVGFFHFSGIDLLDLDTLSRHQNRILMSDLPELRDLLAGYRKRVEAAGHSELAPLDYTYGYFQPGGQPVPPIARRALQRVDPFGRRWQDPFDTRYDDSFYRWLTEPLRCHSGTLNRAALSLWEERPYLWREFKDVCGADLLRYVQWLKHEGGAQREGLGNAFLESIGQPSAELQTSLAPFLPHWIPEQAGGLDELITALQGDGRLGQPKALLRWLIDPVPGVARPRPVVPRFALWIHQVREDLQRAFPNPLGDDQAAYAVWICRYGRAEMGLSDELIAPVRRSLPLDLRLGLGCRKKANFASSRPPSRPPAPAPGHGVSAQSPGPPPAISPGALRPPIGLNLMTWIDNDPSLDAFAEGLADACCQAPLAHCHAALDLNLWGSNSRGNYQTPEGAPYSITLVLSPPERAGNALARLPAATKAGVTVAYWPWDVEHLPHELARWLPSFAEIWTPSEFSRRAIEVLADRPVRCVRPCIPQPTAEPWERSEVGLDADRFYFLSCQDGREPLERANLLGSIAALRLLLKRTPRSVGLVLLVFGAGAESWHLDTLRAACKDLPIVVQGVPRLRSDRHRWLATCDAYLSLHRADASGFFCAESLLLDRPVVATAYGGVVEFLDEDSASLVAYERRRLELDLNPFPPGIVWAEPDLAESAAAMERLIEGGDLARAWAANGRARVEELFGPSPLGAQLARELRRLGGDAVAPGAPPS